MNEMTLELISMVPVAKICLVVVTSQIPLPFKDILKNILHAYNIN